jgi:Mrp family chromosome partitioning ATPase
MSVAVTTMTVPAREFSRGASASSVVLQQRERGSEQLDYFRRIYLSLSADDGNAAAVSIGVTSPGHGDGRTTVAIGVAAAMASDLETPVILVDADLDHPQVHRALGIADAPGLAEYLRGECNIPDVVRQIAPRWFVLPAGNVLDEPARLIHRLATANLRLRLHDKRAVFVFDLPPLLPVSYGALAATIPEALLFVVRGGHTTTPEIKQGLSRIEAGAARSIVVNQPQPVLPRWLRS